MTHEWKSRLTPFDYECLMMVDSLTGVETEPKNGGDHYFFEADYRKYDSPEVLGGIWQAIEGRFGDRILEMWDDPERKAFFVRVKFAEFKTKLFTKEPDCPKLYLGERAIYREGGEVREIRAMQVRRNKINELLNFVGNGEYEQNEDRLDSFHWLNFGTVYGHAEEGDWLVYVGFDRFIKVDKNTFENEYRRI